MSLSRTELLNEFDHGWFECDRWQPSILSQLPEQLSAIKSSNGDGGSGGKPKSKPPMDLSSMDLFYDCVAEVRRVEADEECSLAKLERLRSKARLVLGYDVGTMSLPEKVCHVCGGPLVVARDASSAVECVECGFAYPCESWVDLLQQEAS